jgi:hypothetical protein
VNTLTTYTGNTPQTGDSFARLTGTGAVTLASLAVTGTTTFTGNVAMAAGLTITQSSANTSALVVTGNGTGHGILVTSGSGATGDGIRATSASGDGDGCHFVGSGPGRGLHLVAGVTGNALYCNGSIEITSSVLITGTTTFAGAIGATHASNQISLGTDMITAGTIATDAIGSSELAATAVSEIFTTQLTESYRATNAAPTAAQAIFEILQNITEFAINSTTKTVKKLDGSTTAKTYTLDSATVPTSITETT